MQPSIEMPILNEAVANLLASSMPARPLRKNQSVTLDKEVMAEVTKIGEEPAPTLAKAFLKQLNAAGGEIVRLAFEQDPTQRGVYSTLYKHKTKLLPDNILKRVVIQDDLCASIVGARQNQISGFGRPRPDRFSTGFVIETKQEALEKLEKIEDEKLKEQKKEELQQRIAKTTKRLMTCGDPNIDISGFQDKLTFPQYLYMATRNAIVLGRMATEVLRTQDNERRFVGFRLIDAGTIYRCEPQHSAAEAVRRQSLVLLSQLRDGSDGKDKVKNIDLGRFMRDEYDWVQVIDERPVQAFAADECLVHMFYPVPDIELDGYPVTPLDTVIAAVTTHLNITTHNKLYFESGRAARGMIVIESDDVDAQVISNVRQQFNAQINSVNNAWRMPVFGVGTGDKMTWQAIDSGSRDMEFQYLADMNARIILSAFQMSPEELPGWSYLSRGTNNQALSESNNEWKMEAARDIGIRPLLAQFEDFLNQSILPLFDSTLAETCVIKLVGLDAETAEKESIRIQQDMPVHMTYDEVLEKVEKKAVGKRLGGEFPLNPQYQAVLDKYVPVGIILKEFFGIEGADKDPQFSYLRDPFWFQWQQLQLQAQQAAQQQQAAAQQQQAGNVAPGDDQGGGGAPEDDTGTGESAKPTQETSKTEKQKSSDVEKSSASGGGQDLSRSLDQAIGLLSKSESQLPPSRRDLVARQKLLVTDFVKGWQADVDAANAEILKEISKLAPRA